MELWNLFTSLNIAQQINLVVLIISAILIIIAIVEIIKFKMYLNRVDDCLADYSSKVLRGVEKTRKEKE